MVASPASVPHYLPVPVRSVAWLPCLGPGGPLVEELGIPVPGGWDRLPLPDAVRVLHRHAAWRDVTGLVDVTGAGAARPGASGPHRLRLDLDGHSVPVDSAYLASMVFVGGGPYLDLLLADPGQARRDPRLFSSGALLGFAFPAPGAVVQTAPAWRWHAWMGVRALAQRPLPSVLAAAGGFTDAGADPLFGERNCAFAFALAVAFDARDLLPLAASYPGFSRLLDAWL